jgi:hypothetical protein
MSSFAIVTTLPVALLLLCFSMQRAAAAHRVFEPYRPPPLEPWGASVHCDRLALLFGALAAVTIWFPVWLLVAYSYHS